MLRALREPGVYDRLERLGARMEAGMRTASEKTGVPLTVNRVGSMLTAFFCDAPVTDWNSAARADRDRYARFFHAMLERGVYLAPSQFEAGFLSTAHGDAEIDATIEAAREAFAAVG